MTAFIGRIANRIQPFVIMLTTVMWVNCLIFDLLTIGGLLEINIGISKGTSGNYITTNTNRKYRASGREFLEQHGFCDIRVQIAYIE